MNFLCKYIKHHWHYETSGPSYQVQVDRFCHHMVDVHDWIYVCCRCGDIKRERH
jgi:hypothetical protein